MSFRTRLKKLEAGLKDDTVLLMLDKQPDGSYKNWDELQSFSCTEQRLEELQARSIFFIGTGGNGALLTINKGDMLR